MRSSTLLPLVTATTTLAHSDFHLPYVTSHQPQGVAAGQEDYYAMWFNITSNNTSPLQSGYCGVSWSDNSRDCGNSCVPYSTGVPLDWRGCHANLSTLWTGPGVDSPFSFQLSPYFSIGNFSIALRQNITDDHGDVTTLESTPYQITNTSAAVYSCVIRGSQTSASSHVGQHANGDCTTPTGTQGFSVPVQNAT